MAKLVSKGPAKNVDDNGLRPLLGDLLRDKRSQHIVPIVPDERDVRMDGLFRQVVLFARRQLYERSFGPTGFTRKQRRASS